MNPTIEVLRIIGSPFAPARKAPLDSEKLLESYWYSKRNKIALLFLESIENLEKNAGSKPYHEEVRKYKQMLTSVSKISRFLADKNIDYVIFKTVRPYRSATVDIDMLILGGKSNYAKCTREMQRAGYRLIVHGPKSTTLLDEETNIGIDVYEQIAVSYMTYMDKEEIIDYTSVARLPNGECIKTLKPEADLGCLIAHSIIKEQMYTLSEYYTFVYYLKEMDVKDFVGLVKQNNIASAARTHATITKLLHQVAHKTVPGELQQILDYLGEESFETARLIKNRFETPHKYHPIVVAKSLLEITKGKKTRISMATQLIHMLNPDFSQDFTRKLVDHLLRKTY